MLRLDRLLISGGTRLVLFLPMLVVINFGLAQSYRNTTPEWWLEHVQEVIQVEMSTGMHILSIFILFADLSLLLVLFLLLTLTRKIFRLEAESLTRAGLTFKSSHGYAEMRAIINGSRRQVVATMTLLSTSAIFLLVALQISTDGDLSPRLVSFSTGTLLAGQGVYLVSNQKRFNANEPWGMLDSFSPPIHPALLRHPFSDVIKAHVDPLLAVRISEYLRSVEDQVKTNYSISQIQEVLLHLLHLRRKSLIDEDEFRNSIESMIEAEPLDRLFNHPELGEETWERLLSRAQLDCAPFFRLHDRLFMRYESGRSDDIWFDVDMENLVVGPANLFAFVLNQTNEPIDLILRVQTPDFRPNECVYNLKLNPFRDVEDSILNKSRITKNLPNLLSSTRIIWQSLLPSSNGEATVTIRLEDKDGNLVSGRVLTVQIRSDLFSRLRLTTGAIFIVGAIIAILSPILPFIGSILGL
ncbi:MAG: hypothetical protein CND29_00415 [Marine Group II euryarchaeote MED-G36]|nr:MAG: hypothetical protein CND29_00415 [Marine Group II euryarchaeote MED-G36]